MSVVDDFREPQRLGDERQRAVALGADGRFAVGGGDDGRVRVWNLDEAACVFEQAAEGDAVNTVALIDGSVIASTLEGVLHAWDLKRGTPVWSIRPLEEDDTWVEHLAPGADGIIWAAMESGPLLGLDTRTGAVRSELQPVRYGLNALAVAADGRHAILGAITREILLFDLRAGRPLRTLRGVLDTPSGGHSLSSGWAAIAPDGRRFVLDELHEPLRVRDARTGAVVTTPAGQDGATDAAAFTPDGRHLVTASWGGCLRVWDSTTGAPTLTLRPAREESNVRYDMIAQSPDGAWAVTAGRGLRVWDLSGLSGADRSSQRSE